MLALLLALVLNVRAYPSISLPPATVRITATIPRDPDNRQYVLIWADEFGEIGRSEKSMNGDKEPITVTRLIDHLGSGNYRVLLILVKADGSTKQVQTSFIVGEVARHE